MSSLFNIPPDRYHIVSLDTPLGELLVAIPESECSANEAVNVAVTKVTSFESAAATPEVAA